MALIFLLSMIATLLLGNQMSPAEFGDFALLKTFILIGATFSIFGMDQGAIRNNLNGHPTISLSVVNSVSIILSIVFSFTMKIIFSLSILQFLLLWGIVFFNSNVLYISSIHRLKNKFIFAQVLHSFWKVFLFVLVGICFLLKINIGITNVYKFLFYALLIVFISHYLFISRSLKNDNSIISANIQKNAIKDGVLLWLINVLGLVFSGLDRFIIPVVTDKTVLGSYYAITFIYLTGFTMIGSAIGYVIFPHLAKGKLIKWKQSSIYIASIIFSLIVILIFGGKIFTSIGFNGKYDFALNDQLVLPVLIIGIIQCIHTIIHFYIISKLSNRSLRKYLIILFATCLIYYFSFIYSSINYNLYLIMLHVGFLWFIKLLMLIGVAIKLTPSKIVIEYD
jgi:O-antigen/teichoic acid export membrane protein